MEEPTRERLTDADLLEGGWELIQEQLGWDTREPRKDEPETSSSGRKDKGPRLLAAVNAGDVAARRNVTTGAFYHRWSNRKDFVEALASYILAKARHFDYLQSSQSAYDQAVSNQKSIVDLVYSVAKVNLEARCQSAAFAVQMNLWSVSRRYPMVRARIRRLYSDVDTDWTANYKTLLGLHRWQLRPNISTESAAVVLGALAEGMAIRHAVDPEAADVELFGTAIAAIVWAFIDWDCDGESVEQKLDAVTHR